MSSINTVSGNGNKNYVSGLASGMDTESIVKSLLMGTQTKIDKQSGLKQQLEWKQDIYRDLITKINTFPSGEAKQMYIHHTGHLK